jgi:sugar lactone lactonase YvrE
MSRTKRPKWLFAATLTAMTAAISIVSSAPLLAQSSDPNSAPNPYREDTGWAKTAMGRPFGAAIGIDIDRDGRTIWVFDRCGGNTCIDSRIAPLLKFDARGRLVGAYASGLVNDPHGLFVDRDNNIWLTDRIGKNGKGHTVFKLDRDGKVLMTLGKPGVPGDGPDTFNSPSDVLVAPNGDIFVADGHGAKTNARIVKLSKDGRFIKAWGKEGKAAGEFDQPHGLAMDSQGRLFVADRANNRVQIFDQDGKFIAEWKQFGRPSGIFIDRKDVLYVADSQSGDKNNPGFKQGIRIGTAKDGKVTAFIPETKDMDALEGVAADAAGNVYAGYTNKMNFRRFVRK